MTEIVLQVEGLEFHADTRDDEPRVLDIEIGKRAGMARPTNIRTTIKACLVSGFLEASEVRTAGVQTTERGGRPGTAYWLTEAGALKLITKLETPEAHAMVGQIIRVYRVAIRLLNAPPPPPMLPPATQGFLAQLAACRTVGENVCWRQEVKCLIGSAADKRKTSWAGAHGQLRKHLGVPGYLRIPASLLDETRNYLRQLMIDALAYGGPPPDQGTPPAQGSLFG